ncbi:Uncharacterised protein [Candidatus Tiddalikarchaeum anstoanum]|nr:Uncharacterised protein [Candidatus Tiddalikarchaeum anstoanum]
MVDSKAIIGELEKTLKPVKIPVKTENVIYVLDFDGVCVYNAVDGIDKSHVKKDDFKYFFADYAKQVTALNPAIVRFIKELNENNVPIYILTGRTRILLGDFTESLLNKEYEIDNEKLKIKIDKNKIIYFPEKADPDNYFSWKSGVIDKLLKDNQEKEVCFIDDDKKLLNTVNETINSNRLNLIYYKYSKTGYEELEELPKILETNC